MTAQKIIIDTDPGQDDAVAILLALASPDDLDVMGLTIVAGNVPLLATAKNALMICELAGKPATKVFAGCDQPLGRPLVTAEHVHGKTGLDGRTLAWRCKTSMRLILLSRRCALMPPAPSRSALWDR
jgi:purine nucleosidase